MPCSSKSCFPKLLDAIVSLLLLPLPILARPQAQSGSERSASRVELSKSEEAPPNPWYETGPCASLIQSDVIYWPVKATYVGGTVPGMPLKPPNALPIHWLGVRQMQVSGKLVLDQSQAIFCFDSPNPLDRTWLQPKDTECTQEGRHYQCAIRVPYSEINGLSRATKLPAQQSSARTSYVTAASAVLTAVISSVSKAHAKELIGGITVFAGVAGYLYLVHQQMKDNYIALFLCPPSRQSPPCCQAPGVAASVFPQGALVMFRVPNYHDYYNLSMILSAETGMTFVPELAEAGPKSPGP